MNKNETTCLTIKPDGVKDRRIGEILRRIEQRGLKIVGLQMFQNTPEMVAVNYPDTNELHTRFGGKTKSSYDDMGWSLTDDFQTEDLAVIGKMVRGWLIDFLTSAPMVKVAVEGPHAISQVRKIIGDTMPYRAEVGTIRGDFSNDSPAIANHERRVLRNLVHASENPVEAENEINLYFSDGLFDY